MFIDPRGGPGPARQTFYHGGPMEPLSNADVLLRGVVLGFSIAAPVGPIGVLCIRRTLAQGRLAGLLSGLGVGGGEGAASLLVASVFAGFVAWWLLLSAGVGLLRDRIGADTLRWINRASGAIVFAFGVVALAGVFR